MMDDRTVNSCKEGSHLHLETCELSHKLPRASFLLASQAPIHLPLPIYGFKLVAGETTGFKSPAQDYEQEELDLNKRYVVNRPATYFFRVGKYYDSMVDAGIFPDSVVIVDTSLEKRHNTIVVAAVDGEWVVKRLYKKDGVIKLLSANREKNYSPIEFNEWRELDIFGVARTAINDLL